MYSHCHRRTKKIDIMDINHTVSIICLAVWLMCMMVLSDTPTMDVRPQTCFANPGDEVRYQCFVSGTKTHLFNCQWYFYQNGETSLRQLVNGEKYNWSCTSCSLPCWSSLHITIKDVTNTDTGTYVCAANTSTGTVRKEAQLRVYGPAKLKSLESKPMVIHEGDRVEIRCLVDGWPEPKTTWRLDNGTQINGRSLENVQGSILVLENVTNSIEGNYTCIAYNNRGSDECSLSLAVTDLHVNGQQGGEDITGSSSENHVVHVVSAVAAMTFITLIALIVVIIFIRRKRLKRRKAKPNPGIRSANGQQQPSPSRNIRSGNGHAEVNILPSEDPNSAEAILESNTHIDGSRSTEDIDRSQTVSTVIDGSRSTEDIDRSQAVSTVNDGSRSTEDIDRSQVHANIDITYSKVKPRSSTSNPENHAFMGNEVPRSQVSRTEELNYAELEFKSEAQNENSRLVIRGSPSNTNYAEVVVFTR